MLRPDALPDTAATRALLALKALKLVPDEGLCPNCSSPYKLMYKSKVYCWYGSRSTSSGCTDCLDKEYLASSIGFLRHVKQSLRMSKLECFALWIFEYP